MFTIHVVNSVKGGCGKSTFALFLANYLQNVYIGKINSINTDLCGEQKIKAPEKVDPIIIDLDLFGSSWYKNHQHLLPKDEIIFINDLIDDFDRYSKKNYISKLNINFVDSDKPVNNNPIDVILADSNRAGEIREDQLDLFENSICKLVLTLVERGKTDIILDMPPGYEDYSERIVKHLLFDINSPLYKKSSDKYEYEYEVKFYMLSILDMSIEANSQYINNLTEMSNYSTDVEKITKSVINFVVNDIENVYENWKKTDPDYKILIEKTKEIVDKCCGAYENNIVFIPNKSLSYGEMKASNVVEPKAKTSIEKSDTLEFNSALDKINGLS